MGNEKFRNIIITATAACQQNLLSSKMYNAEEILSSITTQKECMFATKWILINFNHDINVT